MCLICVWCCGKLCKCCLSILWLPLKLAVRCLYFLCPPVGKCCDCLCRQWSIFLGFIGGSALGWLYHYALIAKIHLPTSLDRVLFWGITLLLGLGNVVCRQLRCICLLTFPMYCGKPGRGVLKALVLTYVINDYRKADLKGQGVIVHGYVWKDIKPLSATNKTFCPQPQFFDFLFSFYPTTAKPERRKKTSPITNMALNAKEVVRVFNCNNELRYNVTLVRHKLMEKPFLNAILAFRSEFVEVEDTMRSLRQVLTVLESEMEDMEEINKIRETNDAIDRLLLNNFRSEDIEKKYKSEPALKSGDRYLKMYLKKLEYRCHDQLSRVLAACIANFNDSYVRCQRSAPKYTANTLCWPTKITYICNMIHLLGNTDICNASETVNPGLGDAYVTLKAVKDVLTSNTNDVNMQYYIRSEREAEDVQDPKETNELIRHSFEEKLIIIKNVITVVQLCVALLFLRIFFAAVTYHDAYLTSIEYDNVYVTSYFKRIDKRRRKKREVTLLPLKKMERNKYVDVWSSSWTTAEYERLLTQTLKVMLEIVTATTFVMLDRMFYEALDVVRQHAEADNMQGMLNLDVEVKGTGVYANLYRNILSSMAARGQGHKISCTFHNGPCLPKPRTMPPMYFVKIYGGYLWIMLLLVLHPYTVRLRRLICSRFYPRREKQRILHLYNDILKKRMKIPKTLRRKAIQSARAYYLSGETMLSLRMKFPHLLGWLKIFPAARMMCLICGQTEPRYREIGIRYLPYKSRVCYIFSIMAQMILMKLSNSDWKQCPSKECPFVYCEECWAAVGEHCLACDPSLADLSDMDSLSEEEQARY